MLEALINSAVNSTLTPWLLLAVAAIQPLLVRISRGALWHDPPSRGVMPPQPGPPGGVSLFLASVLLRAPAWRIEMATVLWFATDDAVRLVSRPQAPPERRLVAQTRVGSTRFNPVRQSLFERLFPANDTNSDLLAPGTVLSSTPLRDPDSDLVRGVREMTDEATKEAKARGLMRRGRDPFFPLGSGLWVPFILVLLINLLIFGPFMADYGAATTASGSLQTRILSTLVAIVGALIIMRRMSALGRASRALLTPQGRSVSDGLKAIGAFLRLPEPQRAAMLLGKATGPGSPARGQTQGQSTGQQRDRLLLSHAERLLPWAVLIGEERACLEWIAALHGQLGTAPTWCMQWTNTSLADSVVFFERETVAAHGQHRR